ncbi:PREDICTED: putative fatty acyl-CoA reductase CG5065 [Priapulus caudatus]|uniref:Fatty acyl-CoA reductase n=1 Tax=Priapulus caudatus TaxID=37621 RepID=A0ABM1EYN8_PRICU|nr:PREDICTED: putative fatty acyl-CoA reductase CG5065 [Priapulus caudatus]
MSIEMADDITASSPTTPTIREFYAGRSILVTGSTGFLGKVLVEKFLRACPRLARIYVLIRPKDGKDAKQRLAQILAEKLFDRVRQATPGVEEKVVAISGDITEPNLGVAASDEEALQREVSIVFHSAATVRFDDHLRIGAILLKRGGSYKMSCS